MKFSTIFTAFVVVVPLLSGQALAAAQGNKATGKGTKAAPPPPPAKNNAVSNNKASNNTASNNTVSNNTTSNNNTGNGNPQTSLTLDPSVINTGSEQDGSVNATAGQTNSLTSSNNFINVCIGKTITDGQQIKTGSCNPTPMGDIPSTSNIPAARFQSPLNGQDIAANTTFNIVLGVQGMQTGDFTNADSTYYSAPQQLNAAGQIIGHNHITCQSIPSFTSTAIPNGGTFAFFKGLNLPAQNGQLTATVTGGLAPGVYRCCSITTTANHVSVAVAVAQRGSIEDCSMFSVGQGNNNGNPFNGNGGNNNTAAGNNAANNTTAAGNNAANNTTAAGNKAANNTTAAGNNTTAAGNKTGKNGANNNNAAGNNGGKTNKKGPGGRRRMVARLARDY